MSVGDLNVLLVGLSEPPASSSLFEDELLEVEVVVTLGGRELGLGLLVGFGFRVLDGSIDTRNLFESLPRPEANPGSLWFFIYFLSLAAP